MTCWMILPPNASCVSSNPTYFLLYKLKTLLLYPVSLWWLYSSAMKLFQQGRSSLEVTAVSWGVDVQSPRFCRLTPLETLFLLPKCPDTYFSLKVEYRLQCAFLIKTQHQLPKAVEVHSLIDCMLIFLFRYELAVGMRFSWSIRRCVFFFSFFFLNASKMIG